MLDIQNAERMIRATLELRPDWVWGRVIRINAAVAAGRHAEAWRIGEEFARDNPHLPLALSIAAEAALYFGKYDDALKLLDRLETCAPGFLLVHHFPWRMMRGVARVRLGFAARSNRAAGIGRSEWRCASCHRSRGGQPLPPARVGRGVRGTRRHGRRPCVAGARKRGGLANAVPREWRAVVRIARTGAAIPRARGADKGRCRRNAPARRRRHALRIRMNA